MSLVGPTPRFSNDENTLTVWTYLLNKGGVGAGLFRSKWIAARSLQVPDFLYSLFGSTTQKKSNELHLHPKFCDFLNYN